MGSRGEVMCKQARISTLGGRYYCTNQSLGFVSEEACQCCCSSLCRFLSRLRTLLLRSYSCGLCDELSIWQNWHGMSLWITAHGTYIVKLVQRLARSMPAFVFVCRVLDVGKRLICLEGNTGRFLLMLLWHLTCDAFANVCIFARSRSFV